MTKLFFSIIPALFATVVSIHTAAAKLPQSADTIAIRFADSEIKRFPEAWQLDHGTRYVWGYAQGVGCKAMLELWKYTRSKKYYDYVYQWANHMVQSDGAILGYRTTDYNIDFINAGKLLFDLYDATGHDKYRMAMDTLIKQLAHHPKTKNGVFWHKKIYPHQIWLDGIYMAGPFMAQYGSKFNRPEWIDMAAHEAVKTFECTLDKKSGLLYHAWDESRSQAWCDPSTGHSPNFWGRAIGWYFMAVVDILDFLPLDHPQRKELIHIVRHLAKTLPRYQDKTGLWYQVVDMGNRQGNFTEASVSAMFMYAYAKAVNKGYLPDSNMEMAKRILNGLCKELVVEQPDGTLSLTRCCAVGGLGGKPYRDGSFEYYIGEKIRDNDAKATGPFIMGCLEIAKFDNARRPKHLAFPGATGFGRYASGGRGGEVCKVTNLEDDGPGSFREAVSRPHRIVVFDVGGVIRLKSRVRVAPHITIAGQTAPGDGITIYGYGVSFASNNIVRHIRLHGSIGMERGSCTLVADNLRNAIFDHVSVQWGRWDNLHVKYASDITFQYCIFGEAIDPQRFGALIERPDNLTIHHCLWIDNQSRNPKGKAFMQYYNNIVYNWGHSGYVGGHSKSHYHVDMIGNYFIAGPNSSENYLAMMTPTDHIYQKDNYVDTNRNGQLDGSLIDDETFREKGATLAEHPYHGNGFLESLESATEAYQSVLLRAGAYLKRDQVDKRLIDQLTSLGKSGAIIHTEGAVGGQPPMRGGEADRDSDNDGIPDQWERKHELNPNDASDASAYTLSKIYTNIEVYINELLD